MDVEPLFVKNDNITVNWCDVCKEMGQWIQVFQDSNKNLAHSSVSRALYWGAVHGGFTVHTKFCEYCLNMISLYIFKKYLHLFSVPVLGRHNWQGKNIPQILQDNPSGNVFISSFWTISIKFLKIDSPDFPCFDPWS